MKQRPIFFLIVILLFMAMACGLGGGGDDDSEEAESSSSSEVAENTESTEAPGPATAAAKTLEAASVSDSTDEEVEAVASPTIAVTPTDEPEPEPEPTAAGAAEQGSEGSGDSGSDGSSGSDDGADGSSGGGAAPSGGGWGESGDGAQSACDHPYFPMRVGSTWTFFDGTTTMVWEIFAVQGNQDNATANMRNTIDNIVINYEWACSTESGLTSFDFATLGIEDLGTQVTMENMIMEGSFMLPADEMVPGAMWDLVLDGALNIIQEAGGETMEISANLISTQHFNVISDDPIAFEASTFDGIQVEETNNIAIVMDVLGTEVAQEINIGSLMQLAYGVGIVNQVYNSDFGTETQNLVSFYIP